MSRIPLTLLALLALATRGAAEEPRPRRTVPEARHESTRAPREDSHRAQTIERARQEILKDPSQKKFILFRHGITESDLD